MPLRGRRPRRRSRRSRGEVSLDWERHFQVDTRKAVSLLGKLAAADIEHDARDKGRKGAGRPMPELSKGYAKRKAAEGGSPLPDLYRSGSLWRDFGVLAQDAISVTIGFVLNGADAIKKWRKLLKQGRNPLGLSRGDLKRFGKVLVKRGMLKEVPGPPRRSRR